MLDKGHKVIMYITNNFAWTNLKMINFLEKHIKKHFPICTFMDEAWTWTIDCHENVEIVSGNQGSGVTYKATWYKVMNELSSYSPHTYGMSATETFKLEGKVRPVYEIWGMKI